MRTRFQIYCDILYVGLCNIRNNAHDSEICFRQADHLHNIPELLRNIENEELHRFYWDCMRLSIIDTIKPEHRVRFDRLWEELEAANLRERQSQPNQPNPIQNLEN